jgi:hypothetical protein
VRRPKPAKAFASGDGLAIAVNVGAGMAAATGARGGRSILGTTISQRAFAWGRGSWIGAGAGATKESRVARAAGRCATGLLFRWAGRLSVAGQSVNGAVRELHVTANRKFLTDSARAPSKRGPSATKRGSTGLRTASRIFDCHGQTRDGVGSRLLPAYPASRKPSGAPVQSQSEIS